MRQASSWIVTNYLVATGIMIPLTGWIAARLGRKGYAGRLDHDELELICVVVHAARTARRESAVSMEYHPEATAPVSSGGLTDKQQE